MTARPVANLVEELSKLPGIGPKTATRLAYHILRDSRQNAAQLAEAILDVKDRIVLCSVCFNFSEQNPCPVCSDPTREAAICVVEEPLDVQALDRTGQFRGRYHVLHGAISPIDGIGPGRLKIAELIERVKEEKPNEVILATNLDIPGDATATYLHRLLVPLGVTVSRPATGLPAGGDLEYADEVTLGRALSGRRVL
ncbi:MAG: recombination mediator RecR [Thermomicrobiales bacterium]|nr:recombination mediator RecR [Thermomicrobiales bacterium]